MHTIATVNKFVLHKMQESGRSKAFSTCLLSVILYILVGKNHFWAYRIQVLCETDHHKNVTKATEPGSFWSSCSLSWPDLYFYWALSLAVLAPSAYTASDNAHAKKRSCHARLDQLPVVSELHSTNL